MKKSIIKNGASFFEEIRTNVTLLKISGTLPLEDKTLMKIFLSHCLTVISISVLAIHTSAYTYDFLIHAAYIETAMESFALIIAFFGGFIRNLLMYWSRKKIQEILYTLDDLWKILNPQERNYIISYIKGAKDLTYFFLSQCIFTIFFYAIAPVLVNSIDDKSNSSRVLPYAFFIEIYNSPYYEIIYCLQVSSVLNVGLTCVGVDMIGPLLINTVCGHLKVIQNRLKDMDRWAMIQSSDRVSERSVFQVHERNIRRTTYDEKTNNVENCSFKSLSSEFRSCLNYHRTILTSCTKIEELTSIIFLTQLVGSTYILSAVGFKLSGNDQDKYKYLSQIIIGIVQLLICNWPPDSLLTESQAVADAIYLSRWYEWPKDLKNSVYIVILRAQKPVRLTAGKFMYLSLETFASMVSTAVSFFTMLRSLN